MNPDRLAELRRQRAQLTEHLDWLDREIAAASASASPFTHSPTPMAVPVPVAAEPSPEAVFATYQANPTTVHTATRRGCFLYLAGALAAFFLGLAAIYFAFYRDRPVILVNSPPPDNSPATSPAGKNSAAPSAPPSSKDRRSDPSHR